MAASEPTSSPSLAIFHLKLTLSQYLGTLTIVWVFPSRKRSLATLPVSRLLRRLDIRSWTADRHLSMPKSTIRRSTAKATSVETRLRPTSAGTSYHQTRWAFYPYSQVTGTHARRTRSGFHKVLPLLHHTQE